RIGVAALDGRDVAEPNHAAVHANQGVAKLADISELAAWTYIDTVGGGRDHPRGGHRVFRVGGIRDLLRSQIEFGELCVGDLDIYPLLLVGDEIDLVDVRHAQQLGSQAFRIIMQLRGGETVAL